jgi:hypothetical protein
MVRSASFNGIIGGATGLAGNPAVIWCNLRGRPPAEQIIYGIPDEGRRASDVMFHVRWDDLAVFAFFKEGQ